MALQIFGSRKCPATRKAERFFKERDVAYHFVDLAEKGLSAGELKAIRAGAGGESLIDSASKLYKDRGLAFMDFDEDEELVAHPLLLRSPVVRDGARIAVGDKPDEWKNFLG